MFACAMLVTIKEKKKMKLSQSLYVDDAILLPELEELGRMIGHYHAMCTTMLRVNASTSRFLSLNGMNNLTAILI